MNKRPIFTLALLCIFAAAATTGDLAANFKGKIDAARSISIKDLVPKPNDDNVYNWRYTFMFLLDDGASFHIQFTYTKLRFMLDQHFWYFSYVDPQGKRIYRQDIVKAEDYSFDPNVPAMKMGPQSWTGYQPSLRLVVTAPDFSADVVYENPAPGWRPGEGPASFGKNGDEWFDEVVFIPQAKVTGELKVGGVARKVTGYGYAESSAQNWLFFNNIEKICTLRGGGDGLNVIFMDHVTPHALGDVRVTWLVALKDGKVLFATDKWERQEIETAKDPRRGLTYAKKMKIKAEADGMVLEGEIEGQALTEAHDVLDMMPKGVHKYTDGFRRPLYLRQKVKTAWTLKTAAGEEKSTGTGIVETCLVD